MVATASMVDHVGRTKSPDLEDPPDEARSVRYHAAPTGYQFRVHIFSTLVCVCVESSRGSFGSRWCACYPAFRLYLRLSLPSFGVMHMLFVACRDATCLSHLLLQTVSNRSGISNRVREMTILGIIAVLWANPHWGHCIRARGTFYSKYQIFTLPFSNPNLPSIGLV